MLENKVDVLGTGNSENPETVLAISRKHVFQEIGGLDFVTCAICGFTGIVLNLHITRIHGTTGKEYAKMYPGRKVIADNCLEKRNKHVSESILKFFASEIGQQVLKDSSDKRAKTNLRKYGVISLNCKKMWEPIKKLWKDPEWRAEMIRKIQKSNMEKYGVDNIFKSPEIQKVLKEKSKEACLKKYGVDNAAKLVWVQKKIRKAQCIKPNKAEQQLVLLLPTFVKYVGDGSFWLTLKDGKHKNPDFVVRPFRKWKSIVELFGVYFHKKEEEQEIIRKYAEIGVRCLVIWDTDLYTKKTQQIVKDKIVQFLTLEGQGSSETNTSDTLVSLK